MGFGEGLGPPAELAPSGRFDRRTQAHRPHANRVGVHGTRTHRKDVYIITATNKSPRREIVVKRVWFDVKPAVEIQSPELPRRIAPEESWSRQVDAHTVSGEPSDVQRLGRCQLSPDDKIIKSRPA